MRIKKTTIYDIAKTLNINVSTVSRALNNSNLVREETRNKILKLAKNLNYRPNTVARSLYSKKTKSIGLVYIIFESTALHSIVSGIETVLENNGYSLIITDSKLDKKIERKNIEVLIDRMVDGIIVYPTSNDFSFVEILKNHGIPVVIIGDAPKDLDTYTVANNNSMAMSLATNYLLEKGHKKISYISLDLDLISKDIRLKSYIKSLNKKGIDFDPELVFYSKPFINGGHETAKAMFKKNLGFSAIVCWNDRIAIGVLDYCIKNKISIPNDCSLISIDDDINISPYLSVPLTCVHFYKKELGINASQLILDIINKKEVPNKNIFLDPYIVERNSVKNIL